MRLDGYDVLGVLAESPERTVLRARPLAGGATVLVKLLAADPPDPEAVARLEHELAVARELPGEWAVRPVAVERFGGRVGLLGEDVGGRSLAATIPPAGFAVGDFLRVAAGLTKAVAGLHAADLLHRDLKPANVVVDDSFSAVRLADFGLATRLDRVDAAATTPLQGTLAYVAPEQTGRLARSVDRRSDLYSVGVTLYQMLTGRLPFEATAPLELVHAHLAATPLAPAEAPAGLAAIVLRLLAKAPEDRYQSAEGLLADLEAAADAWRDAGDVPPFPLGSADRAPRLTIPERLFGREAEIAALTEALADAAAGRRRFVLLSGSAGIGKTALVGELGPAIGATCARLVNIKMDQYAPGFQRPTQLPSSLVDQVLREPAEQLAAVRARLETELGGNLGVIAELVPALALIVGEQPAPVPLGPAESRHRLVEAWVAFARAFAEPNRPLVVFVDDLHWSPAGNLQFLLAALADPRLDHFLVVGAYRPEELSPSHPLTVALGELDPARVHRLEIGPLGADATAELVAAATRRDDSALAEWLHELTAGNPFHLRQVLESLAEDGLLRPVGDGWAADTAAVRAHIPSGDVVAFLVDRLADLPEPTQEALRFAALIGGRFDLATLATAIARPSTELAAGLWPAIATGLLVTLDDRHELAASGGDPREVRYRFRHDRVQQAAHATIPPESLTQAHLTVGRALRAEGVAERLFDVVGHLNAARSLIEDPRERLELARRNADAAARAKEAAAYAPAAAHLEIARELLGPEGWQVDYALASAVHVGAGEVLAAMGRLDEAEAVFALAIAHARGSDASACLAVCAEARFAVGRVAEALDAASDGLARLGRSPDGDVVAGGAAFAAMLDPGAAERLYQVPLNNGEGDAALAARLFSTAVIASFWAGDPKAFGIAAASVGHVLQSGVTPWSAMAPAYTAQHLMRNGELRPAMAYAEAALHLSARLGEQVRANTDVLVWAYCLAFSRPVEEQLAAYRELFPRCHQAGDTLMAGYSLYCEASALLMAGRDEIGAEEAWRRLGDYARRFVPQLVDNSTVVGDLARQLSIGSPPAADYFAIAERHAAANPVLPAIMLGEVARYQVILGRFAEAHATGRVSAEYYERMGGVSSGTWLVSYYVARAVSAARMAGASHGADRKELIAEAADAVEKLRPYCELPPRPWISYLRLAEAELAAANGDADAAALGYLEAIDHAAEHGYTLVEGWATELLGRQHHEAGRRAAIGHLARARSLYVACRAGGKVAALDAEFPGLAAPKPVAGAEDSWTRSASSTTLVEGQLDLASLAKASAAIAAEVTYDRVVDALVAVAVENAGAGRGAFVPLGDAELTVDQNMAPAEVVRYVARTGEPLVIADLVNDEAFGRGPYVAVHAPRSVAAVPIARSGRTVGVLYLENRLLAGAFTPARLEVLRMLSAQMAIALENAHLYGGLEAEVAARTAELSASLIELRAMQAQMVESERLAALGGLVAGVAHEVNTPVGVAVTAASHLADRTAEFAAVVGSPLRRSDLDAFLGTVVESGELILTNLDRATELLSSFKQVAVDQTSEETRSYAMAEYLRGIVASLAPSLRNRQVQIVVDCDEGMVRHGHPGALAQLLTNLIQNSLAHGFPDERAGTIRIEVAATVDGSARMVYADDGVGIAPEVLPRIFEPFFTTARGAGGSGLGLHVVHTLITRRFGGTITVASTPGTGTRFEIAVPAVAVAGVTA